MLGSEALFGIGRTLRAMESLRTFLLEHATGHKQLARLASQLADLEDLCEMLERAFADVI